MCLLWLALELGDVMRLCVSVCRKEEMQKQHGLTLYGKRSLCKLGDALALSG
jgi:hypothetical protein